VNSIHQAETSEELMRVFVGMNESVETCLACRTTSTFSRKDFFVVQTPYEDAPVTTNRSLPVPGVVTRRSSGPRTARSERQPAGRTKT
jgi:hypothetical protein